MKKTLLTEKSLLLSINAVAMLWAAFIADVFFDFDTSDVMPIIYAACGIAGTTSGFAYDRKKKTEIEEKKLAAEKANGFNISPIIKPEQPKPNEDRPWA